MSELFTKDDFYRHLREMWGKRGFPLKGDERIGVPVSDLIAHSRERNEKLDMPYLELWVAILDEHISWFISLAVVLRGDKEESKPLSDFERAVLMIAHKIIGDSTAIRHLILIGFDTAARILLRSVSEYMEVLVAIVHRPAFAQEFVKSNTPESAQQFWQTHLRGGKIRSRVTAAWESFLKQDSASAEWFANWGRASVALLSSLAHPSFAGGVSTTLTPKTKHVEENWLGIWGDRSDMSAETIYVYLQFVFPILLLSRDFPFDTLDPYVSRKCTYKEEDEFHRHIRVGRDILASIILSLGTEKNARYVFPELDLSFLPEELPQEFS